MNIYKKMKQRYRYFYNMVKILHTSLKAEKYCIIKQKQRNKNVVTRSGKFEITPSLPLYEVT